MRLARITSQYFCASVVIGARAAPIVHYMVTWGEDRIKSYCQSKGWELLIKEV